MNEKLNIETCTTATESSFYNGMPHFDNSRSNGKDIIGWEMWARNSTD